MPKFGSAEVDANLLTESLALLVKLSLDSTCNACYEKSSQRGTTQVNLRRVGLAARF